jgi:hypothetical protein
MPPAVFMLCLLDFLKAIYRFTRPSYSRSEAAFASTNYPQTKKNSHETQKQALDRGSTRRPGRHSCLRAGQVLAEITGRNRVLGLQGIRGLAVVSSARTDEVLKVIVANPTMIEAYKAGVPNNGQPFPDGSKIVKLQWKPKKSTEAPFAVEVPDVFTQAFVIEKDSKKFPNGGGWGYALFNYEAASDKFTADPSPSDCGHACHVAVKAKDHIFHPYQKR